MAYLYKVLHRRIIRVEALGHKMCFDLMAIHENPSHFGRAGIDNQSHSLMIILWGMTILPPKSLIAVPHSWNEVTRNPQT